MENFDLVSKALAYISTAKCTPSLTVEDVAREAGFSTDHFNRIFKSHTGYNVMEYVRFRRLVHASVLLRKTDRSVTDIGLACGYDSHDGFGRAFKSMYGIAPEEYRQSTKNVQMEFSDLKASAAAGARIVHALPNFNVVSADTVIDYLLLTDALRFGYDAVSFKWNGTVLLSDTDVEKDGCFIGADMFDNGYCYIYVHVRRLTELSRYVDEVMKLSPQVLHINIEESVSPQAVGDALSEIGYRKITEFPSAIFTGDNIPAPSIGSSYDFHPLGKSDIRAFDIWAQECDADKNWCTDMMDTLRTPLENRQTDRPIGMFEEKKLIGIARLCLMEAHGFRLNNCVTSSFLPHYATDVNQRALYIYASNYALELGYLPYEDTQLGKEAEKSGNFTPLDLGFKLANVGYIVSVGADKKTQ